MHTYRAILKTLANKVFFFTVLDKNNRITEYSAKINRNRALHQNLIRNSLRNGVKVKLRWAYNKTLIILNVNKTFNTYCAEPDYKNLQIMWGFFTVSDKNNRITYYSDQIINQIGLCIRINLNRNSLE
jgi:hypothetical protein